LYRSCVFSSDLFKAPPLRPSHNIGSRATSLVSTLLHANRYACVCTGLSGKSHVESGDVHVLKRGASIRVCGYRLLPKAYFPRALIYLQPDAIYFESTSEYM